MNITHTPDADRLRDCRPGHGRLGGRKEINITQTREMPRPRFSHTREYAAKQPLKGARADCRLVTHDDTNCGADRDAASPGRAKCAGPRATFSARKTTQQRRLPPTARPCLPSKARRCKTIGTTRTAFLTLVRQALRAKAPT